MSKLYFINHGKLLFSTYTDKTVIIGTPNYYKLESLKNVMDHHKSTYHKWLNRYVNLYDFNNHKVLKLSAQKKSKVDDDIVTSISHLDAEDPEDLHLINGIHHLCNCDILVMYDFDFAEKGEDSILSIQGILVKTFENHSMKYDHAQYLDMLYDENL